ncbi:MAG: sigma-70 family RNA polymerase sigma factor, partial [Solirubrobacterales bacterium]|nr:sigma-70 family RNA polymerase sigma factor [Solirubrobacterales bacterium]
DAPIRPWLFRIAHNESVSALRRRRPTAELSAAANTSSASVEDQVAERAELQALLGDLRKLTERQRSALVMRELSGLSHEEIAIALGTSVGAAKQTIYEARRSLFEFAEGRAMDCDEIRRKVSDADGRALRGRRVRSHLRECSPCRSFAEAIPARSADLRALAPAMPMLAAVGVLERIAGASAGGGAGASAGHAAVGGGAGLVGAAVGKTAGAALTANALAGATVVASATIGVTLGMGSLVQSEHHPRAQRRAARVSAPASTMHTVSSLGRPAGSVWRARGAPGHSGHMGRATASTPTTVVRGGAPTGAGRQISSSSPAPAGGSTTKTGGPVNSANAPGRSASGPGDSTNAPSHRTTSPASSETAPRHSATGPKNSETAPRHSATGPKYPATAPGQAVTSPGNSANAPGHSATGPGNSEATPGHAATSPGNSANAPGHSATGPGNSPATAPGQGDAPAQAPSQKARNSS